LGFVFGVVVTSFLLPVFREMDWSSVNAQDKQLAQDKQPTPTPVLSAIAKEDPPYRGLDANLYMQISAEYRACCLQTYRWADRLVAERLAARAGAEKPASVVFDLDETVLDNGRFQTKQIREGFAFDPGRWSDWEENGTADLDAIPGAIPFIQKLQTLGIQPVYITNRNERAQSETLAALERLGIAVPTDLLLCANEATGTNKNSRRAAVESRFEVLLYIGDNLRDFDDVFRYREENGVEGRKKLADDHSAKFGSDWLILPNPAYGEWMKPLGRGIRDTDQLLPKL